MRTQQATKVLDKITARSLDTVTEGAPRTDDITFVIVAKNIVS
jgi:hypothetical protein